MLFVYFSTLLESILKSGLLPSALLAGKNWVGIVGVGIVGVGIIAPTQFYDIANRNTIRIVESLNIPVMSDSDENPVWVSHFLYYGSSINDVSVVGRRGCQGFCDNSTKAILMKSVTMGEGVSKIIQISRRHLWMIPYPTSQNLSVI